MDAGLTIEAPVHPALADIELVVFDLDGTLIDSVGDLALAVDAMLAERGLPAAGPERVARWVGQGARRLVERALAYGLDQATVDEADIDAGHRRFLDHYAAEPCRHTRLYDGARDCLAALADSGRQLALVTNKPAAFLSPILDRLEIGHFFSQRLGGDSLDEKKPAPEPLLHVARHAGVAPDRALMVGDSRTDIEAARAAGFRSLGLTYGYNHGEPIATSAPDFILDDLAALRP